LQVLELLNHINKRVKAVPATQLPLLPMVALSGDANPLVRSFALVYVELGISRAPPEHQLQAVRRVWVQLERDRGAQRPCV
jgi:hypothetical protein